MDKGMYLVLIGTLLGLVGICVSACETFGWRGVLIVVVPALAFAATGYVIASAPK